MNRNYYLIFPVHFCKVCILLSSVVTLSWLQSCAMAPSPVPNDPLFAPVFVPSSVANKKTPGSLYSSNRFIELFDDRKAKNIGDILTIVLEERTSSSKSTGIDVKKDSGLSIDSDGGTKGNLFGVKPTLGAYGLSTDLSSNRNFSGEAGADQSNQLSGTIAVTVVDKYPNGTLMIRGEKWMTLNRGDEFIRISGIIRPEDISPENMILSSKIANARIAYSGRGDLADSQKMGWLSRFLNSSIWPF